MFVFEYTVNSCRQKLCFFFTRIRYKLCSKSLLKKLHRIKLLHIEIIDNAGRKTTKLLPIEFICTSHNSVGNPPYFDDWNWSTDKRCICNAVTSLKIHTLASSDITSAEWAIPPSAVPNWR